MGLIAQQFEILHFFDNANNELVGGTVKFFAAGTSTPKDVWTTHDKQVSTNVVEIDLDASGQADPFVYADGDYKIEIRDASAVLLQTLDNLNFQVVDVVTIEADIDQNEIDIATNVTDIATNTSNIATNTSNIADNSTAISSIENEITLEAYSISSGKETIDGSPDFMQFVPSTTNGTITAGGSNVNLQLKINAVDVTVTADIAVNGMNTAPAANNTCLVNDIAYSNQSFTKTEGEFGDTFIVIDTIGTEITGLNGTVQPFLQGGEMFFALIDTTNTKLVSFERGIAGTAREALSNNDTITLLKASYIFLDQDGSTVFISNEYPRYLETDPGTAPTNDIIFNTTEQVWKQFDGFVWTALDAIFLGTFILDNTESIAAISNQFDLGWAENANFEIKHIDNDTVQFEISDVFVGGVNHRFREPSVRQVTLSGNLEPSEVESANTLYYIYIDRNGQYFFSTKAPRNKDLRQGLYHPQRNWRCLSVVANDSSSDIQEFFHDGLMYYYVYSGFGIDGKGLPTSFTLLEFIFVPVISKRMILNQDFNVTVVNQAILEWQRRGSSLATQYSENHGDTGGERWRDLLTVPAQNGTGLFRRTGFSGINVTTVGMELEV